jgi:hypothetical protein
LLLVRKVLHYVLLHVLHLLSQSGIVVLEGSKLLEQLSISFLLGLQLLLHYSGVKVSLH